MTPADGGAAFPLPNENCGMSLRDWFAGQALAGLTANNGFIATASWESAPNLVIASRAYAIADKMLAERAR